jgi:hypothetical protein
MRASQPTLYLDGANDAHRAIAVADVLRTRSIVSVKVEGWPLANEGIFPKSRAEVAGKKTDHIAQPSSRQSGRGSSAHIRG